MRRSWKVALTALERLREQGFIYGYTKVRKVACVTIHPAEGMNTGPYSLPEAYAWIDGCEAMGAAAWRGPAGESADA